MRRRGVLVALLVAGFNVFAVASPAQASCTEVFEGTCLENAVCGAGELFGWECIE